MDSTTKAELFVAEYQSVRDEWLQARAAQQQVLAWTSGPLVLLVAALVHSNTRLHQPLLYLIGASLLTAASLASAFIWFGDVMRMERASLFLRGRERLVWLADGPSEINTGFAPSPLLWETWRAVPRVTSHWTPKAAPSLVGAAAIYAGLTASGLAFLIDGATTRTNVTPHLSQTNHGIAVGLLVAAAVVSACAAAYLAYIARRLFKISDDAPDLLSIEGVLGDAPPDPGDGSPSVLLTIRYRRVP
jgi:hypothetical protein